MAIDFDKKNETVDTEFDFAALNSVEEDDGIEIVSDNIFLGSIDYIVYEIRKNPKFEELFRKANEAKNTSIEERKAIWGQTNSEASDLIINTTASLNKTQEDLAKATGQEIERVDYFTYIINGTEFAREDLSIRTTASEEYEARLDNAIKMRRDVKNIDKELRRISLAKAIFFSRRYTGPDEYQLSCFKTNKTEKLNEDESFLRKYDFLKSLSDKEFGMLRDLFVKSEMVGEALKTLENNGKERIETESKEGQIALLKDALETSEGYAELVDFIRAAEKKVSARDYDASEVTMDNSELGKLIKAFVNDFERNKDKKKSVSEMFQKFKELDAEIKEADSAKQDIKFEEIEDKEVFEEAVKSEKTAEISFKEEPKQELTEKEIENNMLVSLVLEGGKYKKMMQEIRKREEVIYQRKIDEKLKSYRLAAKYIESDKVELAGLLETPIKPEKDGCYIGDLFVIPEDLDLATLDEKGYAELLDKLDEIKKDKKNLGKDIKRNRKEAKKSVDGAYLADIVLNQMDDEMAAILEAQETAEIEIKIAEFFAGLTEEQLHRTALLISAIGEKRNSKEQAEDLKAQLSNIDETAKEDRQPIMEEALVELVREKVIPRAEHQELVKYIRGYQKGFEDGTYKIVEGYGRDESSLAQVVYDYIDLMERNMDKIKKKEEQAQEQTDIKAKKDQDDDGDISKY